MRARTFRRVGIVFLLWLVLAYLVLPVLWIEHDRARDTSPADMVTRTEADIPGDPINVGLVGDSAELLRAFAAAGWDTADAITLESAVKIGESVIFDRPYPDAPVSTLFYYGRRQDLAFEKPDGSSADRRHHVRLWQSPEKAADGRILWLGAASFDASVGFSHDTAQLTHHIAPDVDAERDALMADMRRAGWLSSSYDRPGIGATQEGHNGGGDRYFTDGRVIVGILSPH